MGEAGGEMVDGGERWEREGRGLRGERVAELSIFGGKERGNENEEGRKYVFAVETKN